ncbi:MAG: hypothetical protein ACREJD_03715 [Phycisphaerales bacterium]
MVVLTSTDSPTTSAFLPRAYEPDERRPRQPQHAEIPASALPTPHPQSPLAKLRDPSFSTTLLVDYLAGFTASRLCANYNLTLPQLFAWQRLPETQQLLREHTEFAEAQARHVQHDKEPEIILTLCAIATRGTNESDCRRAASDLLRAFKFREYISQRRPRAAPAEDSTDPDPSPPSQGPRPSRSSSSDSQSRPSPVSSHASPTENVADHKPQFDKHTLDQLASRDDTSEPPFLDDDLQDDESQLDESQLDEDDAETSVPCASPLPLKIDQSGGPEKPISNGEKSHSTQSQHGESIATVVITQPPHSDDELASDDEVGSSDEEAEGDDEAESDTEAKSEDEAGGLDCSITRALSEATNKTAQPQSLCEVILNTPANIPSAAPPKVVDPAPGFPLCLIPKYRILPPVFEEMRRFMPPASKNFNPYWPESDIFYLCFPGRTDKYHLRVAITSHQEALARNGAQVLVNRRNFYPEQQNHEAYVAAVEFYQELARKNPPPDH